MELKLFEKLYRKLFLQTNGFVLNWPIGRSIDLGDLFILKEGKFSVIGGIFGKIMELNLNPVYDGEPLDVNVPMADPEKQRNDIIGFFPYPAYQWWMKEGCNSDYYSDKMLKPYKNKWVPPDVKQCVTHFQDPTSFFFSVSDVTISKILDFNKHQKRIIRRLATQFFNYNEVYLVTEVAEMPSFSLGISHESNAEMVLSLSEFFNGDILELTSSEASLAVEKVRGMNYLKIRENGGTIAFKAMKMSLSLKAKEEIIRKLHNAQDEKVNDYISELINQNLHNLVPGIEINPSNAGEYFEWNPMSLQDVEVFLGN